MNKVLYIDIGTKETKIVEAEESKGTLCILKTAEMRDMSGFVADSGRLQAVEGFCKSLRKTLDDRGITATSAHVCSSCFEMQHKNISNDFCGYADCSKRFANKFGSTLMACDWQYFGEAVKNNAPVQQMYMTMCKRVLLEQFITCMDKFAGLKIISFESDFTARANLAKFHKHDFETPVTCVVDVGAKWVHCQYFLEGALLTTKKMQSVLADVVNGVASAFSIGVATATKLLYTVGVCKSLENGSALSAAGVNSKKYYELVDEVITKFVKSLQEDLNTAKITCGSNGICVVLSGGTLAIPGVSKLIKDMMKSYPVIFAEIDTGYNTSKGLITDSSGKKLSTKFGLCFGMMCRVGKEHPTNLLNAPGLQKTARWRANPLISLVLCFLSVLCLFGVLAYYLL